MVRLFVRPGLPSSREVVASRQVAAQADLTALRTQLQIYKQLNGFYPTTEQRLAALVVKPDSSPIPQHWIQHLSKLPRDPWRRDYVYRLAGSPESKPFDSASLTIWSTRLQICSNVLHSRAKRKDILQFSRTMLSRQGQAPNQAM